MMLDVPTPDGATEALLSAAELRAWVREVPDFPKPGIQFKDITPLLREPRAFRSAIEHMAEAIREMKPDLLVGVEARGFLFAAALGLRLRLGIAPVRKPGKLPWRSVSESYALEYGSDALHLHEDAIAAGSRVVIVDDVLATGGTAAAVSRLVRKLSGVVSGFSFFLELGNLGGRAKLPPIPVHSLLTYGSETDSTRL